ncbi:MAG: DUF1648 domain-containing protein [Candidatus Eremiobacteraeota bacterium]|nr:DUF1648 domain-containing protein [Candidatus Eremiobacteraeota bacterium]
MAQLYRPETQISSAGNVTWMELIALAVGAAIVLLTIVLTAVRYSELPSRVPLHFGITGMADSYGPRPFIWLTVGLQFLLAGIYTAVYATTREPRMIIVAVAVLAVLLWAQIQIVSAAVTRRNRVPVALFWGVFVGVIVATIVVIQYIR